MNRGTWTDEDKALLGKLKREGLNNEVIAQRMGRSLSSIKRAVAKHSRHYLRRKAWLDARPSQ
jgi:transposase